MALVIPEIQIERVLNYALTNIKTDPSLLRDLFSQYEENFVTEVVAYFSKEDREFPIRTQFPRVGVNLPMIAIVNAGDADDPDKTVLGGFFNETEDTDDEMSGVTASYEGTSKRGTYQIFCLTPDPRESLYLAAVVESVLILNRDDLHEKGLHELAYSVADLRFEEGLAPEFSNSRMVTLTTLHYHAVPRTARLLGALCVNVRAEVSTTEEE